MQIIACTSCGTKNRMDETKEAQAVCGQCGEQLVATPFNSAKIKTKPVIVTDQSFAQDVLTDDSNRPLLLDCWAAWCAPCRMIAPALDELAAEADGRYTIAKLNIDENPQTAAQFQVQSIPTLLVFKNGRLVDRIVGAQPKQQIAARLNAHF